MGLRIKQDDENGIVEIEGIKYSYGLFQTFSVGIKGDALRIESIKDGIVTITNIEKEISLLKRRLEIAVGKLTWIADMKMQDELGAEYWGSLANKLAKEALSEMEEVK